MKSGQDYAAQLRKARPKSDGRWHLDEVFVLISGKQMCLWRAADSEGEILDVLIQKRRNRCAALKLMRSWLKK